MANNKPHSKISDFRILKASLPRNSFSYLLILFILISLPILLIALKQNADNRSRAAEAPLRPALPIQKSPYSFYLTPSSSKITLNSSNRFTIDVYANSKNASVGRFNLLINFKASEIRCLSANTVDPNIIVSNCGNGETNNYITFESLGENPYSNPLIGQIGSITLELQNNVTKSNVQIYPAQDFPVGTYMTDLRGQFLNLILPTLPYCYSNNNSCVSKSPPPTPFSTPISTLGKALSITPTHNYITIFDKKGATKIKDEATIELWIKPEDKGKTTGGVIISKYLPNSNESIFRIQLNNYEHLEKSSLTFAAPAGNSYVYTTIDEVIPNDGSTWTHLAITKKSDDLKIYINGTLRKTEKIPGIIKDYDYSKTYIGGSVGTDAIYSYYAGAIDDLRISDTERPIEENWRNKVYEKPLAIDQNTSGLWRFDSDFLDESDNRLDGTRTGYITFVEGKVPTTGSHPRPPTTPSPTPANQSYNIPVLSLIYFPLDPKDPRLIDRNITGNDIPEGTTLEDERQHLKDTQTQLIEALNNGSTFHAYKNLIAQPSLSYSILKEIEYLKPVPTIEWEGPKYADHMNILQNQGFDICNYVDILGVKEVWLWMYHSDYGAPVESYQNGPFGGLGNGIKTLPLCQKTYTVYDNNYGRGIGEAIEDHTHHLEALFKNVDKKTWDRFVGGSNPPFACGWTHCPPNVMQSCDDHQYDWADENIVLSNCQNWHKNGAGLIEKISCHTWSGPVCDGSSGDKYKVWWMQNIPASWWSWVGDYDESSANNNGIN